MILFDAEDALAVSRFNKEIADFLAIAEPAVAMEIKEAALKGHDHFKTILSDELVKKMDKMVEFLKDKGYEVTYEKFDDFRSDPPYAIGELTISW